MLSLTPTPAEVMEAGSQFSNFALNRRWALFIPYAFLLLIFLLISGFALMRMNKIKVKGDSTGTLIIVYVVFCFLLLVGTIMYATTVNWAKPIF